jgi:predicted ribosomally synthesized peptide with SipW-like signal peptide
MKKILILGATIVLVASLISVGTWAFFSDTETSSGNVFRAGTLNLVLTGDGTPALDSLTTTFNAADGSWYPGADITKSITITNSGSIPMGNVTASFSFGINAAEDDGTVNVTARDLLHLHPAPTGADSDNFSKMVYISSANWTPTGHSKINLSSTANATNYLDGRSLFDLRNGGTPLAIVLGYPVGNGLAAGDSGTLDITFGFNSNAGNGCQAVSTNMTMTISGTQQP